MSAKGWGPEGALYSSRRGRLAGFEDIKQATESRTTVSYVKFQVGRVLSDPPLSDPVRNVCKPLVSTGL